MKVFPEAGSRGSGKGILERHRRWWWTVRAGVQVWKEGRARTSLSVRWKEELLEPGSQHGRIVCKSGWCVCVCKMGDRKSVV